MPRKPLAKPVVVRANDPRRHLANFYLAVAVVIALGWLINTTSPSNGLGQRFRRMQSSVSIEISTKNKISTSPIKIHKRHKNCTLYEQTYECGPAYNLGGPNRTSYAQYLLEAGDGADPAHVWTSWRQGQPARDNSKRAMKVVLMTMNEWPLVAWWTFYHGEMLGFENLYILDSSDDERCKEFLKQARDEFHANVIFSTSDLNHVGKDINEIMSSISVASDVMIKLDTDEFLAVVPNKPTCPDQKSLQTLSTMDLEERFSDCQLSPCGVQEYLDSSAFPLDGSLLRIGFVSSSIPNREACNDPSKMHDLAEYALSQATPNDNYKGFFDSRTFQGVDLGSHGGVTLPPFQEQKHFTALGIFHFHWRCYQLEYASSRQVVIRHGYIGEGASDEDALRKLRGLVWRRSGKTYEFPTVENNCTEGCCTVCIGSCHKVHQVMQHLTCPEASEDNYYKRPMPLKANVKLAEFLLHLKEKYPIPF